MSDPQDPSPDQSLLPEDAKTPGEPEQRPYSVPGTQYSVPGIAQSLLLLGSGHSDLGEVTIEELLPNIAIGISRGRFPKGYAHVDPNEDAVLAATDGTTTVLVLADGHHGFDAAEAAIKSIAISIQLVIDADLESIVRDLASRAIQAIAETIPSLPTPRDTSRTALTICAIREATIAATTIGDTTCMIVNRRRVKRIGARSSFLAPDTDPKLIDVDTTDAPRGSMIIVASDGFTDFTASVDRSARSAARQSPHDAVETLIADAFAGGAGDNVAVAVYTSRT